MIAPALHKIAERLERAACELDAGHIVASDELRVEARRLMMQAEMLDEGLAE